jgi:WD40 repeat protein
VRVWNLGAKADAVQEHCFKGHTGSVEAVSYSPDGERVASGGADKTVRVWNLGAKEDAAQEHCFIGHTGSVVAVNLSPDRKRLASGSFPEGFRIWNLEAREEVKADFFPLLDKNDLASVLSYFDLHAPITFSPDGLIVGIASGCSGVDVFNLKAGREVNAKSLHLSGLRSDEVLSETFSADGKRLVGGSKACVVQLWDRASGQSIARLELAGPVHALWWNDPEQPNTLLAACIMQLDGVYFPVIYRLHLLHGAVPRGKPVLPWKTPHKKPGPKAVAKKRRL